jgi:glycosyltransferase involved in cell wall biosynthesis
MDELARHALGRDPTTGIFRVLRELGGALHARGARFVRHAPTGTGFIEIDWHDIVAALERKHAPPPAPPAQPPARAIAAAPRASMPRRAARAVLRRYLRWLSPQVSAEVVAILGGARQMLKGLLAMPGAMADARRRRIPAIRVTPASAGTPEPQAGPAFRPAAGDVLLAPGAPWGDPDFAARIARLRGQGGRFALLVHDIIPLRRPQWSAAAYNRQFRTWFDTAAAQADILLAISQATARDITRYGQINRLPIVPPIVVPMGTGFAETAPRPRRADLPAPGSYVLLVSSIETRKNQILAFRAWQLLLEQMPAGRVPLLVLAGRPANQAGDFLAQLANSNHLDGHIRHITDASDADLAELYRGCRFSLYPSLYEGWGLPVTESLHFGRPCLAANRTSLPEAGGALAQYFDPDNLSEVVATLRRAIEDEEGIEALAARIASEFQPASWDDMADAVRAACLGGQGRAAA